MVHENWMDGFEDTLGARCETWDAIWECFGSHLNTNSTIDGHQIPPPCKWDKKGHPGKQNEQCFSNICNLSGNKREKGQISSNSAKITPQTIESGPTFCRFVSPGIR